MEISELTKIAKAFIKGKNPKNARGCYITPDGSIFYRDNSGLQFARANVKNTTKIVEFDETGKVATNQSADEESVEILAKIAEEKGIEKPKEQEETINLDRMNRNTLVKFLLEIDPTHKTAEETKAQLKDLIVAANTLTGFKDAKLIDMIKLFSPDIITKEMTNKAVTKVFNTEELKALVIHSRDAVELSQDIADKLFALDGGDN